MRRRDEAVLGHRRPAGLDPVRAGVGAEQVVLVHVDLLADRLRPGHVLDLCADDCAEAWIPERVPRKRGHVPRGRVVVAVEQAARAAEVRVRQAELLRLLVHQRDEPRPRPARAHRQCERVVVAGKEQQPVEELPRLHPLAGPQALGDRRDAPHRTVDRDDRVRAEPRHRDERGHDLRRRGDLAPHVRALRPEHLPGRPVDEDRRARADPDPVPRDRAGLVDERTGRRRGRGRNEHNRSEDREKNASHRGPAKGSALSLRR